MLFRFMKVSERSEHSKWSKFVWQKKITYFLGISAHLRSDNDMIDLSEALHESLGSETFLVTVGSWNWHHRDTSRPRICLKTENRMLLVGRVHIKKVWMKKYFFGRRKCCSNIFKITLDFRWFSIDFRRIFLWKSIENQRKSTKIPC